ncbi:porin [Gammaproteobacteria bacterium AS21]
MKKSIIALAVAGAMTAPMVAQADATLFGEVRYDIADTDGQSHLESRIDRVRFGVKGEETMDNGLTAGYFIRFKADTTEQSSTVTLDTEATKDNDIATDKIALYIAGDFGKVILGDADSPVAYIAGRQVYTTVHDGSLETLDDEFEQGGISYESNNYNGFSFKAGIGDVDGDDTAATGNENQYGFSVDYDAESFGVTLAGGEINDKSVAGISGEYKFGAAKVGLAYIDHEDNSEYVSVSAAYVIDKLSLAAQYEIQDWDNSTLEDSEAVNVSATYDLGGNAYVALSAVDFNSDAENNDADARDQVVLRYGISF